MAVSGPERHNDIATRKALVATALAQIVFVVTVTSRHAIPAMGRFLSMTADTESSDFFPRRLRCGVSGLCCCR